MKFIIIFLIFIGCFNSIYAHDIHISYCHANLTSKSFIGKVVVYKDDYFKSKSKFNSEVNNIQFFKHFFGISANQNYTELTNIKCGEDNSTIWFEFSFTSVSKINKLIIVNKLLFNLYSDQMNMMQVSNSSKNYTSICTTKSPLMNIIQ
jgi:hypothetical protein